MSVPPYPLYKAELMFRFSGLVRAGISLIARASMARVGPAGLVAGMLFLENGAPEDLLPALILVTVGLCSVALATRGWLNTIEEFGREACSPEDEDTLP